MASVMAERGAATLPPLASSATVSVFMPAVDAAGTIEAALRSVRDQPEVDDIVVALGPCRDGTAAVLAELTSSDPRLRVVSNPTGRIPTGLNLAWRAASGEVLVRVDAHSVLPEGYVGDALEALRSTGAANVGGRQRPVASTGFAAAVATAMASVAGSGGAVYRHGTAAGEADTVFLGVYRREALEAIGGYDERFERNEDTELNVRLRAAGYRVWFTPNLVVDYRPRDSVTGLSRQYFSNGRWRRLTSEVHPRSTRARQLLPSVLLVGILASVGVAARRRRVIPLLPVLVYPLLLGALVLRQVSSPKELAKVVLALATMHLSFGAGFLVGPPNRGGARGTTREPRAARAP